MVEAGTLCANADVIEEAGANANATYTAEAYTNKYIKKAEGVLCMLSGYNWVTNYASVSTIGKELLRDATSSYAAIKCIKQDMGGFTSRQEALIMINILWANWAQVIKEINKDTYKKYVLSADGTI
jgi:hypothetical protein